MACTTAEVKVSARELSHSLRLRVVGMTAMRRRWWWAAQLIRLAALVAGCDVDVTTSTDGETRAADGRRGAGPPR